ncbi:hypothetical protein WMY93_004250 [Mugilogobius chulae]|uniref:Gag-pol polyprotein n=1 Tax=Mugilogobius chulae TaxID=88201 RepID=A0AAW0PNK1_9GOBI
MGVDELKEAFRQISLEADKVIDANDDLEAALAETWTKEAGSTMKEEQSKDIKATAKECEDRLEEVQKVIRETVWSEYGQPELSTSLELAEREGEVVSNAEPNIKLEAYDFMLSQLEKRMKVAKEAYDQWSRWAPAQEKKDLQGRMKGLEVGSAKLVSRKATLIQSKVEQVVNQVATTSFQTPTIKLRPTALPRFDGCRRNFHSWKKDWQALQAQGEPTGSQEVRKFQLLDSLEEKVQRDLRLSTCGTAEEIFRLLENRFGNKTAIALEIVEELQAMPSVKGHQPKKIIELIRVVEKALSDLSELGDTGALKNPLMTKSLESKLPEVLKKEWLLFVATEKSVQPQKDRFDMLLSFLKSQEGIYEELDQLREEEPVRREPKAPPKQARTRATRANPQGACAVCGESGHKRRLYRCKKFKTLSLAEKKAAIRQSGTCKNCLEVHEDGECKTTFLCKSERCKGREGTEHHYLLCPNPSSKNPPKGRPKTNSVVFNDKKCTEDQEEFLTRLTPELAQQCRNVFCNMAARTLNSAVSERVLGELGLKEFPVIMMILKVTANAGQQIGTLIDLASDTNYITHEAADELHLRSEDVTLVVHGVGGMQVKVETKRYLLKIRVSTPKGTLRSHQLVCYGLDSIAEIHHHVSASQLQKIFPDIPLQDLTRPTQIQLLISHKEGRLVPQKVRSVGDLVLWDGPLGKTVAGSHPDLVEKVDVSAHASRTHFARSMRTAATSIGAACEPKCGGCRCGKCQPGGKEMTLSEERELELVKSGLTYVAGDHHCDDPHWHAKYPWTEDPAVLPGNKRAVEATFMRTERQLAKEPEWKAAYKAQVHDMVERKAAIKLSKEVLESWSGPVWYISHLIAPNPHSVTTPVRLVWNSSQRFKGQSLNDLLLKGPDVLNNIRAVLIRFRQGVFAALGDIKKMYNSIWLEDREMHLHRFLWRDSEAEEVAEYAITRVNIGDKPAGCIAQVAMRETAGLPEFAHLREERRVLEEDTYVDDILTSHDDWSQLQRITANVELILKTGGFQLKPWVYSGQSGRGDSKDQDRTVGSTTFVLPNQLSEEDNKALGMGYTPENDELRLMISVNFSKRRRKMRLGKDLSKEEVRQHAPNPLTRRELLSQVSGLYDPLGLVTPVKQKGAILVRRAFQEVKGKFSQAESTWDMALSDGLREDSISLLEDYAELGKLRFPRALTPPNAKLTPLDHKGDPVKAEVCGAVYAARLKKYFEKCCRIRVEKWYHFVDSQTVLGAVQRESYGYQTFFANRIGEIQSSTNIQDWWWIPGPLNIADIITRGARPDDLGYDSEWQNGPKFLHLPETEWPVKSAKEVAAAARENVIKLQKKAFAAILTRASAKQKPDLKKNEAQEELHRPPAGTTLKELVDVKRFSD